MWKIINIFRKKYNSKDMDVEEAYSYKVGFFTKKYVFRSSRACFLNFVTNIDFANTDGVEVQIKTLTELGNLYR